MKMNSGLLSPELVLRKVSTQPATELTNEEGLVFYRELLQKMKAAVYINQIEDIRDFTTACLVWANDHCLKLLGFTLEEARNLGYTLFTEYVHPEDVAVSQQAIDFHSLKRGDSFGGLARFFNKNKESFWTFGYCLVLSEKNGKPWQFLNAVLSMQDEMHAQIQLLELQKENMRLKNKLSLVMLGKREVEILKMIASGKTDKDISNELKISFNTVRTHHKNILSKLNLNNSAGLAAFASMSGLI